MTGDTSKRPAIGHRASSSAHTVSVTGNVGRWLKDSAWCQPAGQRAVPEQHRVWPRRHGGLQMLVWKEKNTKCWSTSAGLAASLENIGSWHLTLGPLFRLKKSPNPKRHQSMFSRLAARPALLHQHLAFFKTTYNQFYPRPFGKTASSYLL